MNKDTSVDDIFREEEGKQISNQQHDKAITDDVNQAQTPETVQNAMDKRGEKVRAFTLDVAFDDIPDVDIPDRRADTTAATPSDDAVVSETSVIADTEEKQEKANNKSQNSGCLKRMIYLLIILIISFSIAYVAITYIVDALGIGKPSVVIDVEVQAGADTATIAEMLAERKVINSPLYFRIYSKISDADGKYQVGTFSLKADMGYSEIVETLQTATPRAEVEVTIPEGFTVEKIANLLEQKEVCTQDEFYNALNLNDYDFDFIKAIPDDIEHQGRVYRLEGYLFPDTYNFYVGSSGKAVVEKMLQNFDNKINKDIRSKMSKAGLTIDETIILASLIQGEAAKSEDMVGVSRVLFNRLEPHSGFARLELDSTRDYIRNMNPYDSSIKIIDSAYNTYVRQGLPVGAINNPGLEAIEAVFNPSTKPAVIKCYFFATDYTTGITYFSDTFAKHEAICRKYKIGAYG